MLDTTTMEPKIQRSAIEALDECMRELNIRKRCFARWIQDGRLSRTDAQDRLDRLASAVDILTDVANGAKVEMFHAALDSPVK